jgi:hypothetical protein
MDVLDGVWINGNADGNNRDLILLFLFFALREKEGKHK